MKFIGYKNLNGNVFPAENRGYVVEGKIDDLTAWGAEYIATLDSRFKAEREIDAGQNLRLLVSDDSERISQKKASIYDAETFLKVISSSAEPNPLWMQFIENCTPTNLVAVIGRAICPLLDGEKAEAASKNQYHSVRTLVRSL